MTPEERFKENTRLVHHVLKRYHVPHHVGHMDYEDLYQVGCIGLWKASNDFDESKGFKFATLAVRIIDHYLEKVIRNAMAVKRYTYRPRSLSELQHDNGKGDGEIELQDTLEGLPMDDTNVYVQEFVQSLPSRLQQIVNMRMQGMKQREIQDVLGISQVQVSREMRKAAQIYLNNDYKGGNYMKSKFMSGDAEKIGKWIRTRRDTKGISRSYLAKVLGVSTQVMWNWEKGKNNPRLDKAKLLCEALGTTVEQMEKEVAAGEISMSNKEWTRLPGSVGIRPPDKEATKSLERLIPDESKESKQLQDALSTLRDKRKEKQGEIDALEAKRKELEAEIGHIDYAVDVLQEIG